MKMRLAGIVASSLPSIALPSLSFSTGISLVTYPLPPVFKPASIGVVGVDVASRIYVTVASPTFVSPPTSVSSLTPVLTPACHRCACRPVGDRFVRVYRHPPSAGAVRRGGSVLQAQVSLLPQSVRQRQRAPDTHSLAHR